MSFDHLQFPYRERKCETCGAKFLFEQERGKTGPWSCPQCEAARVAIKLPAAPVRNNDPARSGQLFRTRIDHTRPSYRKNKGLAEPRRGRCSICGDRVSARPGPYKHHCNAKHAGVVGIVEFPESQ